MLTRSRHQRRGSRATSSRWRNNSLSPGRRTGSRRSTETPTATRSATSSKPSEKVRKSTAPQKSRKKKCRTCSAHFVRASNEAEVVARDGAQRPHETAADEQATMTLRRFRRRNSTSARNGLVSRGDQK